MAIFVHRLNKLYINTLCVSLMVGVGLPRHVSKCMAMILKQPHACFMIVDFITLCVLGIYTHPLMNNMTLH